jgi:hypothetical protein
MIKGIGALLGDLYDTPDWEKDVNDPAAAISHQMLIEIGALTGFREVLRKRINELLRKHGDIRDLIEDLHFVQGEIADDLQRALHGTDLGKQCQADELEWPLSVDRLRKESR